MRDAHARRGLRLRAACPHRPGRLRSLAGLTADIDGPFLSSRTVNPASIETYTSPGGPLWAADLDAKGAPA